ncbi:MAG: hypothetical protein CFE44_15515 [Burkholderiales bacterium PBB4]|nr:MAG: hypothetical protein CFE44_15515 [Burkholderiales bacterium PBB4]
MAPVAVFGSQFHAPVLRPPLRRPAPAWHHAAHWWWTTTLEVILMDWEMPGEDGIAATRRLHSLQSAGDVPVVLMVNAYTRARLAQVESASRAPSGVLIKPFTATSLAHVLEDAFSAPHISSPLQAPSAGGTAVLAGRHILVVDDNQMNQAVARGILEHAGATVDVASHGEDALALLRTQPHAYALVLMDVQMPIMDGLTATRTLRQDLGLTLPVLAMTAGVMASERALCRDAGMDDVIGKPLDVEDMLATAVALTVKTPVDDSFAPDAMLRATGNHPATRGAVVVLCQNLQRDGLAPLQQVMDCIAQAKPDDAARQLHSMRGALGSLGARRFAASALALEHAIREGAPQAPLQVLQVAAMDHYRAVIEGATRWLAAQPVEAAPASAIGPDAARVRRWLRSLREQDMNALLVSADRQARLDAALPPEDASALSAAMSALDFEAALHILERTGWGEEKPAGL